MMCNPIRLTAALLVAVALLLPGQTLRAEEAAPASGATKMPLLRIATQIPERRDPFALFAPPSRTLREKIEWIDRAAEDPDVGALALRLETPVLRGAHAAELRDRLLAFREKGKPVFATFDTATLNTYLIASVADEVAISPSGAVGIAGVAAHLYFFRDLLGNLGIEAQVIARGEYKTALEPFTHQEMSGATREQMTMLVEDLAEYYANAIAENRGMEADEAAEALWGGPYSASGAVDAGLVTVVEYPDAFLADAAERLGLRLEKNYEARERRRTESPNIFTLFSGLSAARPAPRTPTGDHVAVVYALGNIVDGRASRDPFFPMEVIAGDDFVDLLREAASQQGVRAIVLRIDSGGGSAIASDRIWDAVRTIREEKDLPVVASLGGMAASGGYYIAMAADEIVAQPNTITGSIGVVGGRLILGELYDKIGVSKEMIGVGPHTGLLDETRQWEGVELEIIESLIEETYREFVTKAAQSRGLEVEEMEALAGGRVWTGGRETALVDRRGGLADSIERARELAGVPGAQIVEYPREKTVLELLDEMLGGQVSAGQTPRATIPSPLVRHAAELRGAVPEPFAGSLWMALRLLHQDGPVVLTYHPEFFEIR